MKKDGLYPSLERFLVERRIDNVVCEMVIDVLPFHIHFTQVRAAENVLRPVAEHQQQRTSHEGYHKRPECTHRKPVVQERQADEVSHQSRHSLGAHLIPASFGSVVGKFKPDCNQETEPIADEVKRIVTLVRLSR